jgi:6-phosphogluconolactonase
MLMTKHFSDPESVAEHAASILVEKAREAVAQRGNFVLAVSGGHTPWLMLRALADEKIPWSAVHIVQVDERVAPPGHPDRNLTHLRETLLEHAPLRPEQIHAMPVESRDLQAAAASYARKLVEIAGSPSVLDVVHLGLGPDGHTASLVPGDPALDVTDKDVAITGVYQGRQRMTLTYPIINRSRQILWMVTGEEKAQMLRRLVDGDQTIPAGRIRRDGALVLADKALAEEVAAAETAINALKLPDW